MTLSTNNIVVIFGFFLAKTGVCGGLPYSPFGDERCPCKTTNSVPIDMLCTAKSGTIMFDSLSYNSTTSSVVLSSDPVRNGFSAACRTPDVGIGCASHELNIWRNRITGKCANRTLTEEGGSPAWCFQSFCYVDKDNCEGVEGGAVKSGEVSVEWSLSAFARCGGNAMSSGGIVVRQQTCRFGRELSQLSSLAVP